MNDKSDDSTLGTGSGRFTTEHETLTERRCADDWLPLPSRWGVAVRWFSTASPLSTPFSIPPCRATRRQALSFRPFPNSLFLFLLSSCYLSPIGLPLFSFTLLHPSFILILPLVHHVAVFLPSSSDISSLLGTFSSDPFLSLFLLRLLTVFVNLSLFVFLCCSFFFLVFLAFFNCSSNFLWPLTFAHQLLQTILLLLYLFLDSLCHFILPRKPISPTGFFGYRLLSPSPLTPPIFLIHLLIRVYYSSSVFLQEFHFLSILPSVL